MGHNKLWKILKEMGIPDYLTCLLRDLYAGQEATVRTGHRTMVWFKSGKGVCQGWILSLCFSSVKSVNRVRLFATPWTATHQASLSITTGACSNSCPFSRSCHPAISSSVGPFSPPAPNPSQHQSLFQLVFNSLHEVAKVLEFQL